MRPTLVKTPVGGTCERPHAAVAAAMWLFHAVALSGGLTFCAATASWSLPTAVDGRAFICVLLIWAIVEGVSVGLAGSLATRTCRADRLHGQRKLLWDACLLITMILCGSLPTVVLGPILAVVSLVYGCVQLRPHLAFSHG